MNYENYELQNSSVFYIPRDASYIKSRLQSAEKYSRFTAPQRARVKADESCTHEISCPVRTDTRYRRDVMACIPLKETLSSVDLFYYSP